MLPAVLAPLARSWPCGHFLATTRRTFIVAIDGPAASGKSTTAKRVAYHLRFDYADSGSLYRAITLKALQRGLDLMDPASDAKLPALAQECQLRAQTAYNQGTVRVQTYLDGHDVTDAIRTPTVTKHVSFVAKNPLVRQVVLQWQRQYAHSTDCDNGGKSDTSVGTSRNLVVDGRDIGTTVFPNAELKVYLVAQAETRAQRRHTELVAQSALKNEPAPSYQEVLDDLIARDQADLHRAHSPLQRANDAVDLDTTNLTIDDQVTTIVQWARQKGA